MIHKSLTVQNGIKFVGVDEFSILKLHDTLFKKNYCCPIKRADSISKCKVKSKAVQQLLLVLKMHFFSGAVVQFAANVLNESLIYSPEIGFLSNILPEFGIRIKR